MIIFKEIFYTLSGALIIFTILELTHAGIVLAYININIILLFWLINAIIVLLITQEKDGRED